MDSSVGHLEGHRVIIIWLHPSLFSQVRALAAAADLANKDRKDSQGICFLGKVWGEV